MNILKINEDDIKSDNTITLLGNEIRVKAKLNKEKYFIGIRPEHLKVDSENDFKFVPKIDLVENLGNEKIVYMKNNDHHLSAKISGRDAIKNSFGFDKENIYIFNELGKRIKK